MMKRIPKLIIVGKAASGKSTLKDMLVKEYGYNYYKPYTTRPRRKTDNDNEYVFVDDNEFDELIKLDMLADHKTFNGTWRYGFSKYAFFDPYNLILLSANALENVYNTNPELLNKWTVLYLDIPYEIRYKRLVERFSNDDISDSIERRMQSDELDFMNMEDLAHITLLDNNYDNIEQILNLAKKLSK